jgi:hypothetical protein
MTRPDAVRRVKSYSAATGYVFQYYFFEVNRVDRFAVAHEKDRAAVAQEKERSALRSGNERGGVPGGEYIYMVSANRQTAMPVKIFVQQSALDAWAQRNGRTLTGTEEYAAAKMRLLQAFDEGSVPVGPPTRQLVSVTVDESNLDALLSLLDL